MLCSVIIISAADYVPHVIYKQIEVKQVLQLLDVKSSKKTEFVEQK